LNTVLPKNDIFVGLDSDGCVFDSMPQKHKQGFIPALKSAFSYCKNVDAMAEIWEQVNLFSVHRGINRYSGLLLVLKNYTASTRDEIFYPLIEELEIWIRSAMHPSRCSLSSMARTSESLRKVLHWSDLASHNLEFVQDSYKVFPEARRALALIHHDADLFVVSQNTQASLFAEWEDHGLLAFVDGLDGQENGNKQDLLRTRSAYYPGDRKLFVGDAPSDMQAARINDMAFFPIVPGRENGCWSIFCEKVWPAIQERYYQTDLEKEYSEDFMATFTLASQTGASC
jgi:phosphoglycolate phosphatase-like HAD superfamily hydrolase